MATTQYQMKLRSPKWQRKRLEIFKRDKFACKYCKDTETELHVHHLYYEKGKEPWEYDNDCYQTLCKYCHLICESSKTDFPGICNIKKVVKLHQTSDLYLNFAVSATISGVVTAIIYCYHMKSCELLYVVSLKDETVAIINDILKN